MSEPKYNRACQQCPAFSKSVFQETDPVLRQELEGNKEPSSFAPKELVMGADQFGRRVFCVGSGRVRHRVCESSGKSHILSLSEPGDLLGISEANVKPSVKTEMISEASVQGCFISSELMKKILSSSEKTAAVSLKKAWAELDFIRGRLAQMMEKPTRSRIASALLHFDQVIGEEWARKDLAEWTGTTIENVIRTLASFEEQKLIKRLPGAVQILDRPAIVSIANS